MYSDNTAYPWRLGSPLGSNQTQTADRFMWEYKPRRGNIIFHLFHAINSQGSSGNFQNQPRVIRCWHIGHHEEIGRTGFRMIWKSYGDIPAYLETFLTIFRRFAVSWSLSDAASPISFLGFERYSSQHCIMHASFVWSSGIWSRSLSRVRSPTTIMEVESNSVFYTDHIKLCQYYGQIEKKSSKLYPTFGLHCKWWRYVSSGPIEPSSVWSLVSDSDSYSTSRYLHYIKRARLVLSKTALRFKVERIPLA